MLNINDVKNSDIEHVLDLVREDINNIDDESKLFLSDLIARDHTIVYCLHDRQSDSIKKINSWGMNYDLDKIEEVIGKLYE